MPRSLTALALLAGIATLTAESSVRAQEGPGVGQTRQPSASASLTELEALAERRYAEDDLDGAIALYRTLAEEHPETADRARFFIAAAWLEHLLGRGDRAREMMTQALSLQPAYPFQPELYSQEFVDIYNRSLAALETDRQRQANEATRAAIEAMNRRDHEEARRLLEQAAELKPDDPTALYNLSLLDLRQGREAEAITGFQRLLAIEPRIRHELRVQSLNNLGLLYYSKGFFEDAEHVLSEAVKLDPSAGKAWNNLGLARRRLGRHAAAAEAFSRARKLAPRDVAVVNNLALAYVDAENWVDAVALLLQASNDHPDNLEILINLGLARRGLGNLEGAAEPLQRAVELDPGNAGGVAARALSLLALVSYERGDHERAVDAARQTLEWQPNAVDAWMYLGLAQRALGDLEGARASLERAVALDPTRADTPNNLGNVYFALGEYAQAEEQFRRALTLRPDFAKAQENLELARTQGAAPESAERRRGPKTATGGRSPAEQPSKTKSTRTGSSSPGPRGDPGLVVADGHDPATGLRGASVETVAPKSPAEAAGLSPGDLILRVEGRPISGAAELTDVLRAQAPGSTVALDILRGEEPLRLRLSLN